MGSLRLDRDIKVGLDGCRDAVSAGGLDVALFAGVHVVCAGIEGNADARVSGGTDAESVFGTGGQWRQVFGESRSRDHEVAEGLGGLVADGNDWRPGTSGQPQAQASSDQDPRGTHWAQWSACTRRVHLQRSGPCPPGPDRSLTCGSNLDANQHRLASAEGLLVRLWGPSGRGTSPRQAKE